MSHFAAAKRAAKQRGKAYSVERIPHEVVYTVKIPVTFAGFYRRTISLALVLVLLLLLVLEETSRTAKSYNTTVNVSTVFSKQKIPNTGLSGIANRRSQLRV